MGNIREGVDELKLWAISIQICFDYNPDVLERSLINMITEIIS